MERKTGEHYFSLCIGKETLFMDEQLCNCEKLIEECFHLSAIDDRVSDEMDRWAQALWL